MAKPSFPINIENDMKKSIKELTNDINEASLEWDKGLQFVGDLAIQALFIRINFFLQTKSSEINIILSKRIEKLTRWLVAFTIIIAIFTVIIALPDIIKHCF